ncbi:MAG: PAS domain S-box protein [Gammaproteobacteria bacterium]
MNRPMQFFSGTTGKVATAILLVITGISLLGQLTVGIMVDGARKEARNMNRAGFQRTLTQRSALLAADYQKDRSLQTAQDIVATASLFQLNNSLLLGKGAEPMLNQLWPPAKRELKRIQPLLLSYFSSILASASNESVAPPSIQDSRNVLNAMQRVVALESQSAEQHLDGTMNRVWLFAALNLLVTIGLGVFVLRHYLNRDRQNAVHLLKTERLFKEKFESSPLVQYSVGDDWRMVSVNTAWEDAFGYQRADVIGKSAMQFIAPQERDRLKKQSAEDESMVSGVAIPVRYMRRDGSTFPANAYISEAREAKNTGNVKTYNVITIDMSEAEDARERADHHLQKFEESFRFSPIPLFSADCSGTITRANPAFLKLASVGSVDPVSDLDLGHLIRVDAQRLRHPQYNGSMTNKQTVFDADGKARDVIMSMRLARAKDQSQDQIEGAISDITELETVKRQVQSSRARFRSLYDETPVMLCSLDYKLRISDTNKFMCSALQAHHHDLRTKPFASLIATESKASFKEAFELAIIKGEMLTIDVDLMTSEDQTSPTRVYARPLFDRGNALQTIFVTMLDLTDVVEANEARDKIAVKLRTAEKLEAVGQLAAGIAHEINTPCQYVTDNLSFLAQAFDEITPHLSHSSSANSEAQDVDLEFYQEELPDAIAQSIDGMTQITKIVGAMRDFSHPGTSTKDAVDLNRLLESVTIVARNEWKYIAELELDLDPTVGDIPCSNSSINQVMLNMVVNAAHAMEDKFTDGHQGKIKISTLRHTRHVEIVIQDNGSGIPHKYINQIFNPFFTTKEVGKGTGQGLTIAHRIIVEEHGGSLNVDSTPGEGTRFEICLPTTAMENVA